jgi:deoxyadenosine/deoxycytidine kinase
MPALHQRRQSVTRAPITRQPVIVELVGPAAAGKSSLLRLLSEREGWRAGLRLPKHRHLWSAATLLPTCARLRLSASGATWTDMKRIVYLRTLQRAVAAETRTRHRVVVLDEGAAYMLARIRVYGVANIQSSGFLRWWSSATSEWARTLGLLVWLDASDDVLADRLRRRPQHHRMQDADDRHIGQFLASYRAAYAEVLSAFASVPGLIVLRFRTDREPLSLIAESVCRQIRDRTPYA